MTRGNVKLANTEVKFSGSPTFKDVAHFMRDAGSTTGDICTYGPAWFQYSGENLRSIQGA